MPAHVVIRLNTQPPVVTVGAARFRGSALRLNFTVDEEAVILSVFVAEGGERIPGTVDGADLVFDGAGTNGTVEMEAVDMVGNMTTASYLVALRKPVIARIAPWAVGRIISAARIRRIA